VHVTHLDAVNNEYACGGALSRFSLLDRQGWLLLREMLQIQWLLEITMEVNSGGRWLIFCRTRLRSANRD